MKPTAPPTNENQQFSVVDTVSTTQTILDVPMPSEPENTIETDENFEDPLEVYNRIRQKFGCTLVLIELFSIVILFINGN